MNMPMHQYNSSIPIQLVLWNHTKRRLPCKSIVVGWRPSMITPALARAPSISILESKFSIKKCPTFLPMYDIKCLPFHRKKLKSLSVLHLLKHLSFTNSLYYSDIKLQHALYKIFIPKIPHSPWARRGCISKYIILLTLKLRDSSWPEGHWNQGHKSHWVQGILCKAFLDSVS